MILPNHKFFLYLLHFDEPISPDHTSQHYVGITREFAARMNAHLFGSAGCRFTQVAYERGISFTIGRVWVVSRTAERIIKSYHNHSRYCVHCTPDPWGFRLGDDITDKYDWSLLNEDQACLFSP